jgi:prevent-host-death family protein
MSQHSLAEAGRHLADLVDRALQGEEVVITRDGQPVVALRPVPEAALPGPLTAADVDWLRRHRVGRVVPSEPDAGELVSQMRDEDWA